ncbi:hypothetical protein [Nonomuraea sp. KM90]|uniref:hypothetical protein n=1 Tax=Nonomuraea sp. KM90 TaxID=3457428 RepID=UPI003FCE6311
MALQFVKQLADDDAHVIATARLCLTEDGRLVPDTDEAARWLFCVPGAPIKRADAERYGLLDEPEPEPEPEEKAAATPANKARGRATNK